MRYNTPEPNLFLINVEIATETLFHLVIDLGEYLDKHADEKIKNLYDKTITLYNRSRFITTDEELNECNGHIDYVLTITDSLKLEQPWRVRR